MAALIKQMDKIPDNIYLGMKTSTGEDKFKTDVKQKLEKAKSEGKYVTECTTKKGEGRTCSRVWVSKKFEKLKGEVETDLEVKLGFKRGCVTTGSDARAKADAKGCLIEHCGNNRCSGDQYRKKNADGTWSAWGVPRPVAEMRESIIKRLIELHPRS